MGKFLEFNFRVLSVGEVSKGSLTFELRGGRSPRSPAKMRSTVASSLGILLPSWLFSDGYSIYHLVSYHFKSLREAFPSAERQPPYFQTGGGWGPFSEVLNK